jgi:hypothetical protein
MNRLLTNTWFWVLLIWAGVVVLHVASAQEPTEAPPPAPAVCPPCPPCADAATIAAQQVAVQQALEAIEAAEAGPKSD